MEGRGRKARQVVHIDQVSSFVMSSDQRICRTTAANQQTRVCCLSRVSPIKSEQLHCIESQRVAPVVLLILPDSS